MNPDESTTTRPATVTTAVAIQYALIALGAVAAVFTAMFGEKVNETVKAELEKADASQQQLDAMANIGGTGTLSIAYAVGSAVIFIILTILVAKGKQVARILTWVLSGLTVLFAALGLLGMIFLSGMDQTTADATQAGYDAVGGWYGPWLTLNIVVSLLGSLAVIILLALPASHPFFRKPAPEVVLPPEANMS